MKIKSVRIGNNGICKVVYYGEERHWIISDEDLREIETRRRKLNLPKIEVYEISSEIGKPNWVSKTGMWELKELSKMYIEEQRKFFFDNI